MTYLILFLAFFRIGLFGFGGGLAMHPLLYQSIQQFAFMPAEEFSDLLAISQVTPGTIIINAATYVGVHAAGIGGAACATAHDLSFQMIDRHNGSRPFCSPHGGVFVSFGAYKRKWTVRDGIVHLCDKAAGGSFSQAGGRLSRTGTTICSEDSNEATAICQPHRQ